MAHVHSVAIRSANLGSTGTCIFEIRATSLSNARLLELSCSVGGAIGNMGLGLGRPAASGLVPTFLKPFQPEDVLDSPLFDITTDWVTPPTLPTNYFRRGSHIATTQGMFCFWAFPKGILIPLNGTLGLFVVTNSSASGAYSYDCNLTLEE